MCVSFLDHSTRQLPTIIVTWAPTPPTHCKEDVLRLQCLIVEGSIFVKQGPSQEALVSHQNALVKKKLRQHLRHLLDNVPILNKRKQQARCRLRRRHVDTKFLFRLLSPSGNNFASVSQQRWRRMVTVGEVPTENRESTVGTRSRCSVSCAPNEALAFVQTCASSLSRNLRSLCRHPCRPGSTSQG